MMPWRARLNASVNAAVPVITVGAVGVTTSEASSVFVKTCTAQVAEAVPLEHETVTSPPVDGA